MKTLACIFLLVCSLPLDATGQDSPADERLNEVADDGGNWRVAYKVISDCSDRQEVLLCLKMKAVGFLNKALAARSPLKVTDYLSLGVDRQAEEQGALNGTTTAEAPTEAELEASLPRSLGERSSSLDRMLEQRVNQFLDTRTIQLTVPADVIEGRKKKGGGMILAAGAMMAGFLAHVFLGKIALIAGKALLVAKIALVLSAVIGLKKLVGGGGGGGGGEGHQVVYASGDHGGGWGRIEGKDFTEVSVDLAVVIRVADTY
ncbi:uncharacterized protein LOC134534580 [Bacillus rossius redtenbacheri]|uniref:uncharacterized protein LOC134534580 n=1 Tax=Bacillus rossius redtenbacheri TaxID=93214 RepID=UPI002FDED8B0